MAEKIITSSIEETQSIAEKLAKDVLVNPQKDSAVVFALEGDLGAGKTTFMQGFAKGLGVDEKILSPTFVIMKHFKILKNKNYQNFYHIDCYRLNSDQDAQELGLKEILKDNKNIVAIEWPERIKDILPQNITTIEFEVVSENKRQLTINKKVVIF